MKSLVIGVVFDLPATILLPFFSSLRKHYNGCVCILTPETDEQLLTLYKEYNIDVHYIEYQEHMYKARYYYIKQILENYYIDIDIIFITDVRDVYFFGNIFNYYFSDFNLFCEPKQIKDCQINSNWILSTYNQETLDCIREENIICNGTILGKKNQIHNYLDIIIKEFEVVGEKFVMDQPITNVLYYKDKKLDAKLYNHSDGPIGTFCHDPNLTIRNIKEKPVIVAHQYDRSKILTEIVNNSLFFEEFQKTNKEIYQICEQKYLEDSILVNFRKYIKTNSYGFGDDSHSYMWKFLVQQLPDTFKFLEIGVYKGQIICLVKLLAPNSIVFGVTPLSAIGDETTQYLEDDYYGKIISLHKQFDICFNPDNIIKGLSNDKHVIQKLRTEKYFDVIYIDGSHNYNFVMFDIQIAKQICKKGGFIIMDDSSYYKDFEDLDIFKGYKSVSDAVRERLETDNCFIEKLCVGHNRIFQKIW